MTYCISVWGSADKKLIEKIFKAQKYCIRILFGDLNRYLDKFCTAARVRPFKKQKLGQEFFQKEHTKPLFHKNRILVVQNIYNYQCCLNMFKILQSEIPPAIFNQFKLSARNGQNLVILPPANIHDFVYTGGKLWNLIAKKLGIKYIKNISTESFKKKIKIYLLTIQNLFDPTEWYPKNFKLCTKLDR